MVRVRIFEGSVLTSAPGCPSSSRLGAREYLRVPGYLGNRYHRAPTVLGWLATLYPEAPDECEIGGNEECVASMLGARVCTRSYTTYPSTRIACIPDSTTGYLGLRMECEYSAVPLGTWVFGRSIPESTRGYPGTSKVGMREYPMVLRYLASRYPRVLDGTRVFGDFVT